MENNVINLFERSKKKPDALIPKAKEVNLTKNNDIDIPFVSDDAELKYIDKRLEEISIEK